MTGITEAVRAAIVAARAPSRAAAARWRAGAEVRALERAFADCPADRAEPGIARAEALLADAGWAEALLAPLVAALAADPFFEPPLPLSRVRTRTGAILHDCPAATVSASVVDAAALAALPPAESVVLSGKATVTRYVRAGGARLRRWQVPPGAAHCTPMPDRALADGAVQLCDGRVEGQLLAGPAADAVLLAVTLRGGGDPLIREYRIADGALARTASADDRASRTGMLLTLLRVSGRADAGERFAAATRDPAFHLRWAAMREWLALDARAALPRLGEMASDDPDAGVRAAAAHTLPLVERRIAEARCRA